LVRPSSESRPCAERLETVVDLKEALVASFSLTAHICGREYSVSAQNDGTGWVVISPAGHQAAGRFQIALRLARNEIGHFLSGVRRDQPWGLVVHAGTSSAVYGTPNPAAGVVLGGVPGDPNSLVARIRRRWRDGDSPRSALENAIEIIRAVLERSGRAAAA
jgi:hypothetical protein